MAQESRFPADFLWGAATSAYQIEGSPLADGAGASIWHRFAHTPGMVRDGDTGDVACDHYRRMPEDVMLMRELGLGAYRFSIAWPRVMPDGVGPVNQRGLDFYRRLVDALRAAGIAPVATLYHWDLPAALDDRGGWTNPDVAGWFTDYAVACVRALDGVELWATLNEPWVVADGGYLHGVLAPGRRSAFAAAAAAHNLLRAHAAAMQACRPFAAGKLGLVVNLAPKHAASEGAEDRAAAAREDAYMNRHYLDPALLGSYPPELAAIYGEAWSERYDAEAGDLATPIDWLGVNYYTRNVVRHDSTGWPTRAVLVRQRHSTHTETNWEVYPEGLSECLRWVRERYGDLPLYVTENGAAFYDPPVAADGIIDDPLRVAYLRDHLRAVTGAMADGVDVRGYFAWSLLDNLEWAHGFSKRFGIVHVDFASQQRTIKASGRFYARIVGSNGAVLDD
ncbi:MAG TPA: GH1 family beta-glucosidase [Thermoanaerobaculia bacterium]|nr:GH1 family beta-glucosidase [Thermoanaerobaculia bacterium]